MDHDVVVRQKMTERYLLDELDPAARDEFEEHFFDCADCALDVHAGALFVEQSKVVLAEGRWWLAWASAARGRCGQVRLRPLLRRWSCFGDSEEGGVFLTTDFF